MIGNSNGEDVLLSSSLLASLWFRHDVPPLKNKETWDEEAASADPYALVTMWSGEKCPIESCKTWSRAKCWSMESENHCVAYAKNHFMNHVVPNHNLGEKQADDLGEALTVKQKRCTRKELAKWWGKPDAPKQNKRQWEEEGEGAAVATNAAGAASSAAQLRALGSAVSVLPRTVVVEICERSINSAVQRADAAIKAAGRQCVAASAQLQLEAGVIQQSLDRLKQSLEAYDDDV